MYRDNPSNEWQEYSRHYTKFIVGSPSNSKYGYVDADTLMKGQYCFANGVSQILIGSNELHDATSEIFTYPNPTGNNLTIQWTGENLEPTLVSIYDMEGKLILSEIVSGNETKIKTSKWNNGYYFIEVKRGDKIVGKKQVVIIH